MFPGAFDLQNLLDQDVATLYTRLCEAQDYCDHVRSHVLADEKIPAKDRYCVLRDATCGGADDALEKGDADGLLSVSSDLCRTWLPWSRSERTSSATC